MREMNVFQLADRILRGGFSALIQMKRLERECSSFLHLEIELFLDPHYQNIVPLISQMNVFLANFTTGLKAYTLGFNMNPVSLLRTAPLILYDFLKNYFDIFGTTSG